MGGSFISRNTLRDKIDQSSYLMLDKYAELIILILGVGLIIAIVLIIILFRTIGFLQVENKLIKQENRKIKLDNSLFHTAITRIFQVIQSNADQIVRLREQMNQVHLWLGDVLSISNLIRSEEAGIDSTVVIEELRRRVKWAKEKEEQQIDESDFYQGD